VNVVSWNLIGVQNNPKETNMPAKTNKKRDAAILTLAKEAIGLAAILERGSKLKRE
jgi:hypothetical protein